MKSLSLPVLLACVALGLPVPNTRALDPSLFNDGFAPLTPLVTQFFLDLEAIPAGSVVTDAQHQMLVADLAALPPGPETPSAVDLDGLATDFGKLAVAGLVNDDLEYELAMDFDVDYEDPDPWLPYVQGDVDFALNPPPPYDPTDPGDLGGLDPVIYETAIPSGANLRHADSVLDRESFGLTSVADPANTERPLHYFGSVRMLDRTVANVLSARSLRLTTFGLPTGETYRLSAVRAADGATVRLGKFRTQTYVPPGVSGGSITLAKPVPITLDTKSDVTFGAGGKQPLTAGFSLRDMVSLVVTDAQGNVRLTRDLTTLGESASFVHQTRLHLHGASQGHVGGWAIAKHTRYAYSTGPGDRLNIKAHGLPPGVPVTVLVDGVEAGRRTTTAEGRLRCVMGRVQPATLAYGQRVPRETSLLPLGMDLTNVKKIMLVDAGGNVLLNSGL